MIHWVIFIATDFGEYEANAGCFFNLPHPIQARRDLRNPRVNEIGSRSVQAMESINRPTPDSQFHSPRYPTLSGYGRWRKISYRTQIIRATISLG